MKLVKLSVLTLCLGTLFVSCKDASGPTDKKDSVVAPAPTPAPAAPKADSVKKDSVAAPAPEKK